MLWLTAVGHLPKGTVVKAPGTLGPLMEYGVLEAVSYTHLTLPTNREV